MSRGGPTYDQERVAMNVARLKKGGENFEVVIDPDQAVAWKEGEVDDLSEVVKSEHIFFDAKKGELASEEHMQTVFSTQKPLEVAQIILNEGEIQLTAEHRERLREAKYNKLVNYIHMNAINPQSNLVHPEERIRRAMDEAKVRVDMFKTVDQQIDDVVDKLRPIIPIKFATFIAEVHLPNDIAAKVYGTLGHFGKVKQENWLQDGSLDASVEVAAGRYNELVDQLASQTHGSATVRKQTQ